MSQMTFSPLKAFSLSTQLAETPITYPNSITLPSSVSMFWLAGDTKSLPREANDGARSLVAGASDSTLLHSVCNTRHLLPSIIWCWGQTDNLVHN